jgi:hypothetical protein
MTSGQGLKASAQGFVVIMLAYVLAHGLTAFLITPVQSSVLPEITVFASLVYLPHGVRVLATWLLGWRAILPLYAGSYAAYAVYTPEAERALLDAVVLESVGVGALSAISAFGLMRVLGYDAFARGSRKLTWKSLLLVGAIASVINSIGQSIVFAGTILPDNAQAILAVYALGDLIGLIVCMVVLMMVFRTFRLLSAARSPRPR